MSVDIDDAITHIVHAFLFWRIGKSYDGTGFAGMARFTKKIYDFRIEKDNIKDFIMSFVKYSLTAYNGLVKYLGLHDYEIVNQFVDETQ